jgi:hypothetical protein
MGTRAVYTFIDEDGRHSVYKHWDGYPKGACQFIANARELAWPLPRFEADEYAAAFVAANKQEAGNVRLTSGPDAHGDLEYAYEVRGAAGRIRVSVYKVGYVGPRLRQAQLRPLFEGTLEDAQQFAATYK